MNNSKAAPLSEIRANARETMLENPYSPVVVAFLFFMIKFALTGCSLFFTLGEDLWMQWAAKIGNLLIDVFIGLFVMGRVKYFTVLCEGKEKASINLLFSAFRSGPDRVLFASLFFEGISFVFSIPAFIYSLYYPLSFGKTKEMLIAFAILFAGSLCSFLVYLFFMPLYYVMGDFPNMSFSKSLKMSVWLMKGNHLRYLGLCISLVPLMILGTVSFGIAFFWISPVLQSAYAHFYLDLIKQKQAKQV